MHRRDFDGMPRRQRDEGGNGIVVGQLLPVHFPVCEECFGDRYVGRVAVVPDVAFLG